MSSTNGFDPSCGNFHVSVRTNKPRRANSSSIEIQHVEWVDDLDFNYYSTFLLWDGRNLTVAEIESVLDEVKVPTCIQSGGAITMILRCADEILEDQSTRFPISIVVSVSSELVREEEEEEEEEEGMSMEIEYFEMKPANPEVVDALERVDNSVSKTREECAVCMEGYGVDTKAIRMPCFHLFHEACIVKWLGRRHICPLCRFALQD